MKIEDYSKFLPEDFKIHEVVVVNSVGRKNFKSQLSKQEIQLYK